MLTPDFHLFLFKLGVFRLTTSTKNTHKKHGKICSHTHSSNIKNSFHLVFPICLFVSRDFKALSWSYRQKFKHAVKYFRNHRRVIEKRFRKKHRHLNVKDECLSSGFCNSTRDVVLAVCMAGGRSLWWIHKSHMHSQQHSMRMMMMMQTRFSYVLGITQKIFSRIS